MRKLHQVLHCTHGVQMAKQKTNLTCLILQKYERHSQGPSAIAPFWTFTQASGMGEAHVKNSGGWQHHHQCPAVFKQHILPNGYKQLRATWFTVVKKVHCLKCNRQSCKINSACAICKKTSPIYRALQWTLLCEVSLKA